MSDYVLATSLSTPPVRVLFDWTPPFRLRTEHNKNADATNALGTPTQDINTFYYWEAGALIYTQSD